MLHICGTAHNDFLGPSRLQKVLEHYKPDIVTVECPDKYIGLYADAYNIVQSFSLEQLWYHLLNLLPVGQMTRMYPNTISSYFHNLGYEIALPQNLGEFVVGVDVEPEGIITFDNFLTCRDLIKLEQREMEEFRLLPENYQRFVDAYYYGSANGAIDTENVIARNKFMSLGIEEAIDLGSVVHFSGDAHVHGPKPTLVDLLSSYNPTSSSLKEW